MLLIAPMVGIVCFVVMYYLGKNWNKSQSLRKAKGRLSEIGAESDVVSVEERIKKREGILDIRKNKLNEKSGDSK